jgi:hypothetical protein
LLIVGKNQGKLIIKNPIEEIEKILEETKKYAKELDDELTKIDRAM